MGELTADWVDLPGDGDVRGYRVEPTGRGPHPGVVVGHQLFGVDSAVRGFAGRLAGLGYTVVVPDLYHRAAPGIELVADAEGRRRGLELLHGLRRDDVVRDVEAAVRHLRESGAGPTVGMVGLSMGGHVAYLAAARLDLAATVAFFPGWLTGVEIGLSRPEPTLALTPGIHGRLLFLVGDADRVVPEADRKLIADALRHAGVDHEIVVYPDTPHAFLLEGAETYRAAAAEDAWRRMAAFLAGSLAPAGS